MGKWNAANWLECDNRREEAKKFLIALNSYVAMGKVEVSWIDVLNAISYMEKYDLDFTEAIMLQMMKRINMTEVYTNDRDFDRVE